MESAWQKSSSKLCSWAKVRRNTAHARVVCAVRCSCACPCWRPRSCGAAPCSPRECARARSPQFLSKSGFVTGSLCACRPMPVGAGGGWLPGRANAKQAFFPCLLTGAFCAGSVGKTSLVLRYCKDEFNDKHITTIQASFFTKRLTVGTARVKLAIWVRGQTNKEGTSVARSIRSPSTGHGWSRTLRGAGTHLLSRRQRRFARVRHHGPAIV